MKGRGSGGRMKEEWWKDERGAVAQ